MGTIDRRIELCQVKATREELRTFFCATDIQQVPAMASYTGIACLTREDKA